MPTLWLMKLVLALLFVAASNVACTLLDPSEPGNLVRPTVDDDPSLPALDVNGTRMHARIVGPPRARTIVTFHGGPGNDFRYLLSLAEDHDGKSLADDHRLVFWDQRGTGLSRRHAADDLDMETYHRDVEALVDLVSPDEPVVLVGHSWGAQYAARYLGHHPERVLGAVFVNMQALTRDLFDQHGDPVDLDLLAEWLGDPLWSRGVVSPSDHARADYALSALLATDLPRFGDHADVPNWRPGAVVWDVLNRGWTDDYDFTAGLDVFPRPVLLVGSAEDRILGWSFQQKHVPLFADARLERLEGAGHNDAVTVKAAELVATIRRYLETLEPSVQ